MLHAGQETMDSSLDGMSEVKQDELFSFFPVPVLVSQYPKPYEEELKYIQNIPCERENKTGDAHHNWQSRDTFVLDRPELSEVKEFIESKIRLFSKEVLRARKDFMITQSWVIKSSKGDYHQEHTHPNSLVSGVLYLVFNEDMPPIMFRSKRQPEVSISVEEQNGFNSVQRAMKVNAGDLAIFPSNMMHGVPPNQTDTERVSLAFNTWTKGSLGEIDALTYLQQ